MQIQDGAVASSSRGGMGIFGAGNDVNLTSSVVVRKLRPPTVDDLPVRRPVPGNRNTVHSVAENTAAFDQIHGTEYSELVRSEMNMWSVAQVLTDMELKQHYTLVRIALGLRWLISDWMMKNAAMLVGVITKDWELRERARLAAKLSTDWPIVPHTSLFAFALVEKCSMLETRMFIDAFVEGWPQKSREKLEEDLKRRLHGRQIFVAPKSAREATPPTRRRPSRVKESMLTTHDDCSAIGSELVETLLGAGQRNSINNLNSEAAMTVSNSVGEDDCDMDLGDDSHNQALQQQAQHYDEYYNNTASRSPALRSNNTNNDPNYSTSEGYHHSQIVEDFTMLDDRSMACNSMDESVYAADVQWVLRRRAQTWPVGGDEAQYEQSQDSVATC